MLGCAIHQSTSKNHGLFLQNTAVNHFNFHKVNLQGIHIVHGKVQKWLLFHKWMAQLGKNK